MVHGTQATAAKDLLAKAVQSVDRATTLSMTVVETTEEFPRPRRTECAFRKGGYLRVDDGRVVRIANLDAAWAYSPKEKSYRALAVPPKGLKASEAFRWLDVTVGNLPILGEPTKTAWHGHAALRIELDGRKTMTKETKLFVFLDPDTHLPLGISANLGSITQVVLIERLKVDPKLDDRLFAFSPPADWKRLSG